MTGVIVRGLLKTREIRCRAPSGLKNGSDVLADRWLLCPNVRSPDASDWHLYVQKEFTESCGVRCRKLE